MTSIILGSAASAIGGRMLGAAGSAIGYAAGSYIGSSIDDKLFGEKRKSPKAGTYLHDAQLSTLTYGSHMPIIYGKMRIAGSIIWASPIKEETQIVKKKVKGFIGSSSQKTAVSEYYVSLAISLGEGPIDDIGKIWIDDIQIDASRLNYRLYKGTEEQMPDYLMQSYHGVANVPAYRGQAYIVIEDFPLSEYNYRIPNFNFEVINSSALSAPESIEQSLRSIVLVPGSGEFVYDTEVQKKASCFQEVAKGKFRNINCNNHQGIADARLAIEQMLQIMPNLEWVSIVVNWFLTDDEQILPGVEYRDGVTKPDSWQVGSYSRDNAYLIGSDTPGAPRYGGTPSDLSLIRLIKLLKEKGLKVMLYPMLVIDKPGKPWRGHFTPQVKDGESITEAIARFFKEYNKFILHYARLGVDKFLIGSEMVALNSTQDGEEFPAIDHWIELAKQLSFKNGDWCKVSYAADWSEYHHTHGGYRPLDELWASEYIDFIGIDAYFPLANTADPTLEELKRGWFAGEGYDFYYDAQGKKQPLDKAYAWKNLKHWWESEHYSPEGSKTKWQPKMKKIIFTEFGFPSVDGAAIQPNIFYDPNASDGGLPRKSSGRANYALQRRAIEASLDVWRDSEMVEQMFLWCYDARPYPYWPNRADIWSDGYKYSRGHWINGKLGQASLVLLIKNLLKRIDYQKNVVFKNCDERISGYGIMSQAYASQIILQLCLAYDITIADKGGYLEFSKNNKERIHINVADIICDEHGLPSLTTNIAASNNDNLRVELHYLNPEDYKPAFKKIGKDGKKAKVKSIAFPMVLDHNTAWDMLESYYRKLKEAKRQINLILPVKYKDVQAGDIVTLEDKQYIIMMATHASSGLIEITAEEYISFEKSRIADDDLAIIPTHEEKPEIKAHIFSINQPKYKDKLLIAAATTSGKFTSCAVYYDETQQLRHVASINQEATIGKAFNAVSKSEWNVIDRINHIDVALVSGSVKTISEEELLSGHNLALFGNEIIAFQKAELLEDNVYRLSNLIRGMHGTENLHHNYGENFILLDEAIAVIERNNLPESGDFLVCAAGNDLEKAEKIAYRFTKYQYGKVLAHKVTREGEGCRIVWEYSDYNQEFLPDLKLCERSFVVKCSTENNEYHKIVRGESSIFISFEELEKNLGLDIGEFESEERDKTVFQIKLDEFFKDEGEGAYKQVHDRGRAQQKNEVSFKNEERDLVFFEIQVIA